MVVTATSALFTGLLVQHRTKDLINEADARLLSAAEFAREMLGPDYHDRIVDASSVSKERFRQIVARNDDLCRRLRLQYLWSVLLVDNRIVFTSATHSNLTDPNSPYASFFETHRDPGSFAPALTSEGMVSFSSFKNEWGRGRQVLVPRKDARGRTYIFGASVQLMELEGLVRRTVFTSVGIGLAILAGALLLAMALARSVTAPVARLTEAAKLMATGDLDVSLTPSGTHELQSLSDSLDQMRRGIKQYVANLRESEEKYRELVENANSIILRVDAAGRITFFNQYASRFFGFSQDEIIGREAVGTIVSPSDSAGRDLAQMVLDLVTHPERYQANENENICKDGTRVWVAWTNKPVLNDQGQCVEVLSIGNDVTDRKQAEEALSESKTRLDIALTSARMGSWYWDIAENRRYFDDEVCHLLGIDPLTFTGSTKEFFQVVHPDDRETIKTALTRAMERHVSYEVEYRAVWPDGSIRYINARGQLVRNDKGQPMRLNGIIWDNTPRRLAEEALKSSLKEKEVLLKEIHHRVKNNLQIMSSLLNLQSRYVDDQKIRDIFRMSTDRIRTMALIHERLYRSENLSRISFAEYVGDLTHGLISTYTMGKGVHLNIDVEPVSLDIDTAIPLGLIINELVSNALKYAFTETVGGTIRVGLYTDGEHRTLVVSDTGVGFPEDLDFMNTPSLGMQLVVTLVEQLEGTIELKRNKGTEFKMTFTAEG